MLLAGRPIMICSQALQHAVPPSLGTSSFTTWSSIVCCSCGCRCSCGCPFSLLPLSCGPSQLSPQSLLLFCLCCFSLCFDQCFWSRSPSGTKTPRGSSKITPTFNNLPNTLRKFESMSSSGQASLSSLQSVHAYPPPCTQ